MGRPPRFRTAWEIWETGPERDATAGSRLCEPINESQRSTEGGGKHVKTRNKRGSPSFSIGKIVGGKK